MIRHPSSTTSRWRGLLTLILTLTVFTVWAGTPVAIEHLSPEDRTDLDLNREVEVIIEFDQTEAVTIATERKQRAGLRYDDEATLIERAQSYRRKKDETLAALATEPVTVQRNFSHLPIVTAKLRSPAALRALLLQPGINAVYSNVKLRHMLAQSLPLIRQPETVAQGGAGAGTAGPAPERPSPCLIPAWTIPGPRSAVARRPADRARSFMLRTLPPVTTTMTTTVTALTLRASCWGSRRALELR